MASLSSEFERHWIIGTKRSTSNIQNVSTQLAGFRKLVELEESGCKVRSRHHAIFCLAATRFFVANYSLFEEPACLRKISKASMSATKPIHGQQRQLVIGAQLVGPASDNVFEQRQSFSMPTKSVKVERLQSFRGERAQILCPHMDSQMVGDIGPQLEGFVEATQLLKADRNLALGVESHG